MAYYKILQRNLEDPANGTPSLNLWGGGLTVDPPWGSLPDTALSAELWENSVYSSQPWQTDAFIEVKYNVGLGLTQSTVLNSGSIWEAKFQIEAIYPEEIINFGSFNFVAWNQKEAF